MQETTYRIHHVLTHAKIDKCIQEIKKKKITLTFRAALRKKLIVRGNGGYFVIISKLMS